MKVLFMGTAEFAVPTLEAVVAAGHEVVGVYTQPDKAVGRKQILTPPPVKVCAEKYGFPVFQPVTLRDGSAEENIKTLWEKEIDGAQVKVCKYCNAALKNIARVEARKAKPAEETPAEA